MLIMDLNFVFATVVALNFIVDFEVSQDDTQDYFIFSGNNSIAHLYRNTNKLNLYLKSDSSQQLWTYEVPSSEFTFGWDQKTVNNHPMHFHGNDSVLTHFDFDAYTFLSPISKMKQLKCPEFEPVFQCDETNYKLIILIVFAIGIALKFDLAAPILIKAVKTKYHVEESLYEEMNLSV